MPRTETARLRPQSGRLPAFGHDRKNLAQPAIRREIDTFYRSVFSTPTLHIMIIRTLPRAATWLMFLVASSLIPAAHAQTTPAPETAAGQPVTKLERFTVTGSLIKRVADEGALPLAIFSKLEMEQEGIASA